MIFAVSSAIVRSSPVEIVTVLEYISRISCDIHLQCSYCITMNVQVGAVLMPPRHILLHSKSVVSVYAFAIVDNEVMA